MNHLFLRSITRLAGLALAAQGHATAVLSAGSTTVIGNDQMHPVVTIPVFIDGAQNLQSFYFDVAFDPMLLRPVHFTDLGTDFATATLMGGGMLTGIMGFSLSGLL